MSTEKPTHPAARRPSRAVSAQYPNGCDTCGAGSYEPCRSKTTGRVTDTHMSRVNPTP